MQIKTLSRRGLVIGTFVGFFLPMAVFYYCIPKILAQGNATDIADSAQVATHDAPDSPQPIAPAQINYGLPVRITIPAITVDAAVESVGITAHGQMDLMKNPDNVAWYQLGSRPGDKGSAVIAGHSGIWKNGEAALFDKLHTLRPGDNIIVQDDAGTQASFIVRESKSYDPDDDAAEVFLSHDGIAHLNLITCEGAWDEASKSYAKRLVVFADAE